MTRALDTTSERRPLALVLDGDDASLRSLRRSLEGAGFDVLCAGDGGSGLDLLLGELLRLDVLVADLDLPVRDARAFAHLVRRAGGERDLAIVVPAHGASASVRAELVALGVDAVVERGEGPRAVAAAAIAAVVARASASAGDRFAAAAPSGRAPAPSGGWLSRFARCSPLAA